jgi:hypothetical protein
MTDAEFLSLLKSWRIRLNNRLTFGPCHGITLERVCGEPLLVLHYQRFKPRNNPVEVPRMFQGRTVIHMTNLLEVKHPRLVVADGFRDIRRSTYQLMREHND